MTIEEMKKLKKEFGYSYEMISELSGVPLGTVQKIFCGVTKAPRYATLCALEVVFSDRGAANDNNLPREKNEKCSPCLAEWIQTDPLREEPPAQSIRESLSYGADMPAQYIRESLSYGVKKPVPAQATVKKQGEYTIEDYYALPEERRVELINGVFYDMASPTGVHQSILIFISNTIFNHIQKNKGGCRVFAAPLDIQLNMDDKTMVQPDILVICSREKYKGGHIYGAPDLAIEILSPSTRGRDLVLKLNKYCEAGVREYWTVDPDSREVTVFTFHEEIESVVYGVPDVVPVGIFEGSCRIDLQELFDYADF